MGPTDLRRLPEWAREIAPLLSVLAAAAAMLSVVFALSLALFASSHPAFTTHTQTLSTSSGARPAAAVDRDDGRSRG